MATHSNTTGLTTLTCTLANVASSATNVTVFAANPGARKRRVVNDSTAILYLKYGATASTSSYTTSLASQEEFVIDEEYTGIVDGIWASANGNARTTVLD